MKIQQYPLDRSEARSLVFSEQEAYWTLPLHETSAILDVAVTKRKQGVLGIRFKGHTV